MSTRCKNSKLNHRQRSSIILEYNDVTEKCHIIFRSPTRFSCDTISYACILWNFIFSSSMDIAYSRHFYVKPYFKFHDAFQNIDRTLVSKLTWIFLQYSFTHFYTTLPLITLQCEETFSFEWPKQRRWLQIYPWRDAWRIYSTIISKHN